MSSFDITTIRKHSNPISAPGWPAPVPAPGRVGFSPLPARPLSAKAAALTRAILETCDNSGDVPGDVAALILAELEAVAS
jgi:hypothetical protein